MQDLNSHSSSTKYESIFAGLPRELVSGALKMFRYQYLENALYRNFADRFQVNPDSVQGLRQIPFLPVSFFKTEMVKTGEFVPEIIFESSGTTGLIPARHYVRDLGLYRESFVKGFEFFYGDIP